MSDWFIIALQRNHVEHLCEEFISPLTSAADLWFYLFTGMGA